MNTMAQKIVIIALVLSMCLGIFSELAVPPVSSIAGIAYAESNTIMAATIEWRYKMENGYTYRRQYNTKTKEWIGEWERC